MSVNLIGKALLLERFSASMLKTYALAPTFPRALAKRDFFREAVFFLITPVFAALSIALNAAARDCSASLFWPAVMNPRTVLVVEVSARLRRTLNTCFLRDARCAFFAEDVIAMCSKSYTKPCIYARNPSYYHSISLFTSLSSLKMNSLISSGFRTLRLRASASFIRCAWIPDTSPASEDSCSASK
jgi:hypothetical protein